MKLIKFDDFVKLANFFYITIGMEPYEKGAPSKLKHLLDSLIFYAGVINLNCVVISEITYVLEAVINGTHFVEATMSLSYIGFALLGNFKMFFVWLKKDHLSKFVTGLQKIYPDNEQLQQQYNLRYYLKQCHRITQSFSALYMILIWTYNLLSIVKYFLYNKWLNIQEVEQSLPYFMYIPWNWHNHWSYYLLYASQDFAGYTSAAGQISSDLLLTSCAIQLVMHYDFVSDAITKYCVKMGQRDLNKEKGYAMDMQFLKTIIQYHVDLLDLSEQVNNIFGIPILLNFAASSFVICFVGFQMTVGVSPDTLVKLLLFLISSIAQVYLICHNGQMLIDASVNVANSVYNQNWSNADVRYQKMLVLIAERAQKPAQLKATRFVLISRITMTELMQISYKFFALLRTMYSEN